MLEDIGAIQARISEIRARIAALSPQTPSIPQPSAADPAASQATFGAALQRAQEGTPSASGTAETGAAAPTGVYVTPASLGPLPAMPVDPATSHLVPLEHTAAGVGTGQFDSLIQTYAGKHNIDPALVRAVIQTESGGNPHAVSGAGAMGLMQLMPSNVKEAGIANAFDPEQNIAAGTAQLSNLLKEYGGDLDLALAGYNAGPGNVRKYGGVPPFRETQNYIRKVRAAMERNGG